MENYAEEIVEVEHVFSQFEMHYRYVIITYVQLKGKSVSVKIRFQRCGRDRDFFTDRAGARSSLVSVVPKTQLGRLRFYLIF